MHRATTGTRQRALELRWGTVLVGLGPLLSLLCLTVFICSAGDAVGTHAQPERWWPLCTPHTLVVIMTVTAPWGRL